MKSALVPVTGGFDASPASFSTTMICSSVCLPFFFLLELLNYGWTGLSRAGHSHIRRSSKNSEAGPPLVTSKRSQARVQAT